MHSDIPPPPGVADPEPYKAGAIAIARPAPEKQSALDEIPADSVGSFVYTGGAIPLNDLSRNGVRYPGLAAVELQAWLKVTQPGRTQIGVEYRATTGTSILSDPTCVASMWLEDRSIGSKREKIPITARGEKTISPGVRRRPAARSLQAARLVCLYPSAGPAGPQCRTPYQNARRHEPARRHRNRFAASGWIGRRRSNCGATSERHMPG